MKSQKQNLKDIIKECISEILRESAPPGLSKSIIHKVEKQYGKDSPKAYATMWAIHNKQKNVSEINGTPEFSHENYAMLEAEIKNDEVIEYDVSYKVYNKVNKLIKDAKNVKVSGPDFIDDVDSERQYLDDRLTALEIELEKKKGNPDKNIKVIGVIINSRKNKQNPAQPPTVVSEVALEDDIKSEIDATYIDQSGKQIKFKYNFLGSRDKDISKVVELIRKKFPYIKKVDLSLNDELEILRKLKQDGKLNSTNNKLYFYCVDVGGEKLMKATLDKNLIKQKTYSK